MSKINNRSYLNLQNLNFKTINILKDNNLYKLYEL